MLRRATSSPLDHSCQLIDGRRGSGFRDLYRALARGSAQIDVAVGRVRLSAIDLTRQELASAERIRVLVGEINVGAVRAEVEAVASVSGKTLHLSMLSSLMDEGRLRVRSVPTGGWAPDFSVFARAVGEWRAVVGTHWFQRPYPHHGVALASVHGDRAARQLADRFQEMWRAAHEVGPAVREALEPARMVVDSEAQQDVEGPYEEPVQTTTQT